MKKILLLSLLVLSNVAIAKLNFVTTTHPGQWVLDNGASTLNFITTMDASKAEVQTFKKLQGHISNTKVSLRVDLKSVDTGNRTRDQRIRELFFNIIKFPTATVTLDLKKSDLKLIKQGQTKNLKLDAEIEIQGTSQTVSVELQVVLLEKNQLLVFSRHPIIVDLKNFYLLKGVNQLRKIAKLQSINSAVPVTFSLIFSHQ